MLVKRKGEITKIFQEIQNGYCIAVSILICFHLLRSFKSNSTLDQGFYTITCDVPATKTSPPSFID
eukprot:bmy_02981T0